MKRYASLLLVLISSALMFADVAVPFFGGNNMGMDFNTTFAADLNDGSTGLETNLGCDLWFEFTPYKDMGLNPRRDRLSAQEKKLKTHREKTSHPHVPRALLRLHNGLRPETRRARH